MHSAACSMLCKCFYEKAELSESVIVSAEYRLLFVRPFSFIRTIDV